MAGFADATGRYLPLVCTLNAARVLTATAGLLGVDLAGLDELALSAPDSGGLVLLPYLDGERTPDLPGRPRAAVRADPGQRDPGATSPGPRSRACCAAWPTASTRCGRRVSRSAGRC